MRQRITYQTGLDLRIRHAYFMNEQCGLEVVPTAQTVLLLRKADILFKKYTAGNWIFLKQERSGLVEDPVLQFELQPEFPDFHFYTQAYDESGKAWEVSHLAMRGVFSILYFPVSLLLQSSKQEIELNYENKSKQWEFICISKYQQQEMNLILTEDKNRLTFLTVEKIDFPGEKNKVYRFVSEQSVPLKERYDYTFRLWEEKENGTTLISSTLPFPRPQSLSVINTQHMITSYLYF